MYIFFLILKDPGSSFNSLLGYPVVSDKTWHVNHITQHGSKSLHNLDNNTFPI